MSPAEPAGTNALGLATSPYLRQHADNPVHWQQWTPQALAEAAARDVPILLSIGYAACHWCHVMAHESFEDDEVAAVMNEHFVNIKVDREERPDIDAVYMDATTALTGQGGWPMTCLLAPDGGSLSLPAVERSAQRGDETSPPALGTERLRFHFPRQRRDRHLCLADFVRARSTGQIDVLPVQLVTAGAKIDGITAKLFAENNYRDYYELNGLVMQLTEALAEFWHARIRSELGFAAEDPTDTAGLFKLEYRGARFSLGYPACPEMEDRRKVVELLRPERMGVELSEELQLHPEQSTDAFVFHHPEAKYFSV